MRGKRTQAEKIIDAFGSSYKLSKGLGQVMGKQVRLSTVARWKVSRDDGGTGGIIPTRWHWYILRAAKLYDVSLDLEDFFDDEVLDEFD